MSSIGVGLSSNSWLTFQFPQRRIGDEYEKEGKVEIEDKDEAQQKTAAVPQTPHFPKISKHQVGHATTATGPITQYMTVEYK